MKNKRKEQGNVLVVYLLMMPLLIGVFGFAVDSAVSVYARNSIQIALDNATLTASTRADTAGLGGNQNIANLTTKEACNEALQAYIQNRPGVATAGIRPLELNMSKVWVSCKIGVDNRATSNGRGSQYVEVQIKEVRGNFFLNNLGIPSQTFNLVSRARLAVALEAR